MRSLTLTAIALLLFSGSLCRGSPPNAAKPDNAGKTLSTPKSGSDDKTVSAAKQVEEKALAHLNAGRQREAEAVLKTYLAQDPDLVRACAPTNNDAGVKHILNAAPDHFRQQQRVLFLSAVCARTRGLTQETAKAYCVIIWSAPKTPTGAGALLAWNLDHPGAPKIEKQAVEKCFAQFAALAEAKPKNIAIRWMLAIQCRNWGRNEEGVKHCRKIVEAWKPGPALVHQLYANMLDELKRFDESLVERRKTVEIEPAAWSYDGLAITLAHLGRWKEANELHAKVVQLEPGDVEYWSNWACTLREEGKLDEAIEKCRRSVGVSNGWNWQAWWQWGRCLEAKGEKAEALAHYRKAFNIEPRCEEIKARIARLEKELKE